MEQIDKEPQRISLSAAQNQIIANQVYPFTDGVSINLQPEDEEYVPWFAAGGDKFGFTLIDGKYSGVFVLLDKSKIVIRDNNRVQLNYTISKNPKNIKKQEFESDDFLSVVQDILNKMLAKLSLEHSQEEK